MNTKEVPSPVPEVGQTKRLLAKLGETWKYGNYTHVIDEEAAHDCANLSSVCRAAGPHKGLHGVYWMCPAVLAATGTLVSTPSPSPTGKVEGSLVGSRWQGSAQAFTVTSDECHDDTSLVSICWDDGNAGGWVKAKLHVDFTRVDAPEVSGETEPPWQTYDGHYVRPLGTPGAKPMCAACGRMSHTTLFYMGTDPTKPSTFPMSRCSCGCATALNCEVRPVTAAPKPAPTPAPLPVERRRVKTYDELLAALCAEEGVEVPKVCPDCGEVPTSEGMCRKRYAAIDATYAASMVASHATKPVAELPPWSPNTDPDFWIPGVNEHGGR